MQEELDTVIVTFDEERGVATLTLNRPDSLNAMNRQMRQDIETGFEAFEGIDEGADGVAVRAVVMAGAGDRAFCAGADVTDFSGASPAAHSARDVRDVIAEFPAPVIAKIDGYCLGGGFETALGCDFRVASEPSTFGFPEVDLGLVPGAGGVQYVTRLAGPAVAKELAMTGKHVSAERAAKEGLVDGVHPADTLDAAVEEFVDTLVDKPPLAVRAVKDSANKATQMGLNEGRQYDRRVFATLLGTEDHEEGAAAFAAADYEPEFVGR